MAATSEAIAMARRLGVDPKVCRGQERNKRGEGVGRGHHTNTIYSEAREMLLVDCECTAQSQWIRQPTLTVCRSLVLVM